MTTTIEATGLHKRYGNVAALDGLDLTVEEGHVVGLLGPNAQRRERKAERREPKAERRVPDADIRLIDETSDLHAWPCTDSD